MLVEEKRTAVKQSLPFRVERAPLLTGRLYSAGLALIAANFNELAPFRIERDNRSIF